MAERSKLSRAELQLNAVVVGGISLPLGLSAFALAMSFAFRPEAIAQGAHLSAIGLSLPACPGCAMCGMSRAFSALAHADVKAAMAYHSGVLLTFPAFLALLAICVLGLYRLIKKPLRLPTIETQARSCKSSIPAPTNGHFR